MRWRQGVVVGLAACVAAAPVAAGRLEVRPVGATSQGYLYVDFDFQEPFSGKSLDAIRSGLPSTLTFTVEIWRRRAGWWDRLEGTRETQVRVLRDLLNEQYVVATPEEVRRFQDLDALVDAVCHHRREFLPPLHPDWTYYVVLSANLAPLSVDDLQELERWLQGTIRSGDESGPGRVAGLSGTMVGLLLSVTGFGDETVRGRSASFLPREVQRAAPPARPGVAGGAPADSGSERPQRR